MTMLCGKPALFTHSTLSPALMVTVLGSKARPPESVPGLTVAAFALSVRAKVDALMPAPLTRRIARCCTILTAFGLPPAAMRVTLLVLLFVLIILACGFAVGCASTCVGVAPFPM